MLILTKKQPEQRVGIGYMSGQTEMYITDVKPDGTIYSTTNIKRAKKMPFSKALSLQMELQSEGLTARKIYYPL